MWFAGKEGTGESRRGAGLDRTGRDKGAKCMVVIEDVEGVESVLTSAHGCWHA